MFEYVLAESGGTPWIGPVVRAVLFTAAGVVLLVVGIRRRVARTRWNREDDRRLLDSDGAAACEEPRSPAPRAGAGWLIATGVVLMLLGVLHILDLVVALHDSGLA